MTTDELSHIRAVVAVLLGMPMKFVLINGVDPSTSVTVTLLLPNDHVKVLRSLLQDNVKDVIMLLHVGVDKITLDGHIYVVSDLNLLYESESDEETQRQIDLVEKYQEARKVVNLYEIENANLKQEIGDLETKLMALNREKNPSEQQDIVKALEKFSEALEHMKVHVKTTAKELRIFKPGCHS
ncbi:uncharacterized protein LOC123537777 [Mercenaria mercenaria]|uniref:uncharacterized protein LOC123537777 n=1 Tax=Mercenaria mercenaria TaxID=6596 RepID=UPI00234F73BD|nr:uncharacterized protein LOC123537777 [Mercenaria mercenaria]